MAIRSVKINSRDLLFFSCRLGSWGGIIKNVHEQLDEAVLHNSDMVLKMLSVNIKTNPLQYSGTKGTLQGFLFFFNQRQLDACDIQAFTKVTFYPKNYTTSNYIVWRSKVANSVQNRIKAGLVLTHHMRLFCMPSLTVCSVRAAAKMTILH